VTWTNMKTTTPYKFAVGDKVSVIPRFGESGEVVAIHPEHENCYEIKFHNLDMTLFFNEKELRELKGKGFSWFRMPQTNL